MFKLIQTRINKIINDKYISDRELFIFISLITAIIFSWGIHATLLITMSVMGISVMVVSNVLSVIIYGIAIVILVRRRAYKLTGIIIVVEVTLYTSLYSFFVGTNDYVICYYGLLILFQIMIPYASARFRTIMSVTVWVAAVATAIVGVNSVPAYPLQTQSAIVFMSVFNVTVLLLGAAVELLFSGIIRNIITQSNTSRVDEYKKQATRDPLTGLYNRRYTEDFIENISERGKSINWCVAMLDVDDFKSVNDKMGHPAGDEVLKNLAGILSSNLRRTDVLCRWGGEEFLIFLSDIEIESATRILNKLRRLIEESKLAEGICVTVTIGAVEVDLSDVKSSISRCDELMYMGKQQGRNQVISASA